LIVLPTLSHIVSFLFVILVWWSAVCPCLSYRLGFLSYNFCLPFSFWITLTDVHSAARVWRQINQRETSTVNIDQMAHHLKNAAVDSERNWAQCFLTYGSVFLCYRHVRLLLGSWCHEQWRQPKRCPNLTGAAIWDCAELCYRKFLAGAWSTEIWVSNGMRAIFLDTVKFRVCSIAS